jgi:sugar phosphate isomerase/epimerase
MKLGVFSETVRADSPEAVAARTRALGVEAVQLRATWEGLDLAGSRADRARVRRAYEQAGVTVAALAAYTNLLDPLPARRRANQEQLEHLSGVAAELGTRVIVTETGSYDAASSWNDHPHNHTPAAWAELVEVTGRLVRRCEREGVVLAYEPYVNSVLDSAPAARRLAEEIGSPALAFVFDPAGLTTAATISRNRVITLEALALLRGRLALAHADDVRYEDGTARWLPLGWGELDAAAVFEGLTTAGFAGALIIEHLAESLVPQALAFCRTRLAHERNAQAHREQGMGGAEQRQPSMGGAE